MVAQFWIPAFLTALVSGLYTSLWGAFKDSPYENFKPLTFPRSVLFHVAIFAVVYAVPYFRERILDLSLVQIFFLIMGIERLFAEIYKGFFRIEDQAKYFIPSRITFFGKFVQSDFVRYVIGSAAILLSFFALGLTYTISTFWQFLLVGYTAGSMVAVGGAYKDAPFEGFDPIKFQRSGVVVAVASPLFYFLGPTALGFLLFMCFGLERFLVEYYKTYIKRNMSGKFRPDIPRIQKWLDHREPFHYGALAIIAIVIALYVHALQQ